ncbi:MAG TPA: PadR family transcriptional regulator [Candidatus Dormibacteraeota bacterium]|jgi:DNA-binding PadR family transcriptional regulator|nr:PadR family transcriptional regulator [Candidatus Dormibacteraeota bacterium]
MPTDLSSTAYVILGMLNRCPLSGYDIKHLADHSTRHFWAISYGQIYPELRALSAAGMIRALETSESARPRTLYELTPIGREALADWAADTRIHPIEIRDEMLLRFFFADVLSPSERGALLDAIVRRHREMARDLTDHEPIAQSMGAPATKIGTLRFGIAFHKFCAEYFESLTETVPAIVLEGDGK